jgi:GNAT superfamily N-acetyltransferase
MNVPPDYIRDNQVHVLEENGRTVGYYGLTVEDGKLVLDRLFVDRDRIGTGCGKQLWRHAVEKAMELGHREMIIGSEPNATSFYEAMGAVRYGEKPTANPEWTVQMLRFTIPETG